MNEKEGRTGTRVQTLPPGVFFGRCCFANTGRDLGFYEYEYSSRTVIPTHAHNEAFVSILVAGSYAERIGLRERANDCGVVYHPPGEEHSQHFGACSTRLFGFQIPTEVAQLLHDAGASTKDAHEGFNREGASLLFKIRGELATQSRIGLLSAEAFAMELLCELPQQRTAKKEARRPGWLKTLCELLDEDDAFDVRLSDVARSIGLSPCYVAREFVRWQGCTVGVYVMRRRIAWALDALRQSEKSLASIARDAGFADQSHFTRVLKLRTGYTPAALRREFLGKGCSKGS